MYPSGSRREVAKNASLVLAPLTPNERRQIYTWPPYPPVYHPLDYALRRGGWLDTLARTRHAIVLGAHAGHDLIGFSLLVPTSTRVAEFFVALRGDMLNRGFGRDICVETLRRGFRRNAFQKIFLIVRQNHVVGIRLYSAIGFRLTGRVVERTNRIPTRFYVMQLTKSRFRSIHGGRRLAS